MPRWMNFLFSEIFSDMATANQAAASGQWLAEWLPKHYAHEETTVLSTIAQMGPEMQAFVLEMKRQHREMRMRLENFRDHLAHLNEAADLESAVGELKKEGSSLSRMMRLHLAMEEKKFGSLEN